MSPGEDPKCEGFSDFPVGKTIPFNRKLEVGRQYSRQTDPLEAKYCDEEQGCTMQGRKRVCKSTEPVCAIGESDGLEKALVKGSYEGKLRTEGGRRCKMRMLNDRGTNKWQSDEDFCTRPDPGRFQEPWCPNASQGKKLRYPIEVWRREGKSWSGWPRCLATLMEECKKFPMGAIGLRRTVASCSKQGNQMKCTTCDTPMLQTLVGSGYTRIPGVFYPDNDEEMDSLAMLPNREEYSESKKCLKVNLAGEALAFNKVEAFFPQRKNLVESVFGAPLFNENIMLSVAGSKDGFTPPKPRNPEKPTTLEEYQVRLNIDRTGESQMEHLLDAFGAPGVRITLTGWTPGRMENGMMKPIDDATVGTTETFDPFINVEVCFRIKAFSDSLNVLTTFFPSPTAQQPELSCQDGPRINNSHVPTVAPDTAGMVLLHEGNIAKTQSSSSINKLVIGDEQQKYL